MANGYWEKLIEIDMTTGKVEITNRHMQYTEEYISGHPLAAKLLWEALKDNPGIDPYGPENPLMFMPGITGGSPFGGAASRYVAYCKSGITQAKKPFFGEQSATIGYGTSGGKFGARLRQAGYDGIYITGISETPKYLYINNGTVELLDASEYWGMTQIAYEKAMQDKYGYQTTVVSIGPAAENGCAMSAIVSEAGRAAGRGGCAPVMGAKKLKGIVCYGDQPIPYKTTEGLAELVADIDNVQWSHAAIGYRRAFGSSASLTNNSDNGIESVRNHREGTNPHDDKIGTAAVIMNYFVRHRSCHACPLRCMKWGVQKTGKYKGTMAEGPEYESAMNGANWLIEDLGEFSAIMEYIEDRGYDLIGIGGTVGYALEAYENGVITSNDINGIKLEWGNADEIIKFMDAMIYDTKNEIFEWFRHGTTYAMQKIDEKKGTNSSKFAIDVKGHSFAAHGVQGQPNYGRCITYSFSNRGACHMVGTSIAAQNTMHANNIGVMCSRGGNTPLGMKHFARIVNFITGRNLTEEDLVTIGEKAWNIEKVFNMLNGFRREDDDLPRRSFEDALTWGPKAGAVVDEADWEKNRNAYYEGRGWDPETSYPTAGKLQELGLDDLVPYVNDVIKKVAAEK